MSHPRTIVLVLLFLAPLVLAPVGSAKPPQAVPNVNSLAYPQAGRADISELALDPTGHYAFVGLRPDTKTACGTTVDGGILGSTPSVPCSPDLAGFDLVRQTTLASGTQGGEDARPSSDATLPIAVAVTPAAANAAISSVYAVKAGPGDVFAIFRAGNSAPTFQESYTYVPAFTAAAINKDNTRIALGAGSLAGAADKVETTGSVVMLNGPPSGRMTNRWVHNFTNGETVEAIAIAKTADVMVVGTSKAVYFHTTLDSAPSATNRYTKVVTSSVETLDISDDGGAVVVGLENGEVYYFVTRDVAGALSATLFDAFYSATLDGAVTAVAVSGDGKWFGAADSTKQFALWSASSTDAGAVAVQKYKDTRPETIVALDTGRTGSTFVAGTSGASATSAGSVYGYSAARSTPSWTLATVDRVVDVAVSDDGNTVTAASLSRFYAWRQTSEVTVTGLAREKAAQPNELVPFTFTLANTGSLEDNYTVIVHAPPGWFVEGERQTRVLAPDASGDIAFSIKAPVSAEPKKHLTWVEVFSQGQNKVVAREFLNITLASISNLRMEQVSNLQDTCPIPREDRFCMKQREELPFSFKVINQGNSYARLNLTVSQAPTSGPAWTIIYPDREQNITLGGEQQFTATVYAPGDAEDGTCNTITFIATAGRTGANLPVTACISPEYEIAVTLNKDTVSPKPGDTEVVSVRVENKGNTKDTITLDASVLPATAALDWRVQISPTELEIARGGVRTATVSIRAAVASPPDVTITIRATSEGAQQSATIAASAPDASEEDDGNFLPAPSFLLVAGAALGAAVVFRRR